MDASFRRLWEGCTRGNLAMVESAIQAALSPSIVHLGVCNNPQDGVSVDGTDEFGITPLMRCAQHGHTTLLMEVYAASPLGIRTRDK